MQIRFRPAVLLLVICLALAPRVASAQVTLTISNPIQTVHPGDTVTFMGTFTNTSLTDTFEITGGQINDVFFTSGFSQLPESGTWFNTDFMVGTNGIVQYAPGDTFTGPIISITVSPSAPLGIYNQLAGNAYVDYNTVDVTTSSNPTFVSGPTSGAGIHVVPEPSAGALLALALGGLSVARRRGQRTDRRLRRS
jgi:hypothetical protein